VEIKATALDLIVERAQRKAAPKSNNNSDKRQAAKQARYSSGATRCAAQANRRYLRGTAMNRLLYRSDYGIGGALVSCISAAVQAGQV
jgi:hypothetical protein